MNSTENPKSPKKFHERFHWTDTLPTKSEKQAIENILIDYHDIFARHRKDIEINAEFEV